MSNNTTEPIRWSKKYPFIYNNLYLVAQINPETAKQILIIRFLDERSGAIRSEDYIECIHTAVMDITPEEFQERIQRDEFEEQVLHIRSSENLREIHLSVDEKFFAFKSWVQGIAEAGLNAFMIQGEIEKIAHLMYPISQMLLRFLALNKPGFISKYLFKIEKECVLDGKPHEASLFANLFPILDVLLRNRYNKPDQKYYQYDSINHWWSIKGFDSYIAQIFDMNPSIKIFQENDDYRLFLTLPQAKNLQGYKKARNDFVVLKGEVYMVEETSEGKKVLDVSPRYLIDGEVEGLEYLKDLEEIAIHDTKITRIRNIGNKPDLKIVNLYRNSLEKVEDLTNLPSLKLLNLTGNDLKSTDGLENLSSLEELDFYGNSIENIRNLENLRNLIRLNLIQNKIENIGGLDSLVRLEYLDLSYNKIEEIKNLNHLNNLKELILKNNGIQEINGLEGLKSLEYLDLSYNKITELKNLNDLPKLKGLNLNNNNIERVSDIENLKDLEILDLSNNNIKIIDNPETIKKISVLYLRGNPIDNK